MLQIDGAAHCGIPQPAGFVVRLQGLLLHVCTPKACLVPNRPWLQEHCTAAGCRMACECHCMQTHRCRGAHPYGTPAVVHVLGDVAFRYLRQCMVAVRRLWHVSSTRRSCSESNTWGNTVLPAFSAAVRLPATVDQPAVGSCESGWHCTGIAAEPHPRTIYSNHECWRLSSAAAQHSQALCWGAPAFVSKFVSLDGTHHLMPCPNIWSSAQGDSPAKP